MATLIPFPYRTVAEISVPSLIKNLVTLRSLSRCEVIPVVKADAYGHGMVPVAKALVQRASSHTLAVATLEEAIELRKRVPGIQTILVLSGFLPHQIDAYTRYRLIPIIHSLYHLRTLQGRKTLPELHLKIDTGMHRLGIPMKQLPEAIKVLEKLPVKLSGVASHFAESESALSAYTDQQLAEFETAVQELRGRRLVHTDAKIHIANSGGILRHKLGSSVAVRPGLSLYGVSPNPRLSHSNDLVPVLEWKTRVLCLKDIARGETVGYGRTYKAKRKEKIAILPIGYADGFPRLLSNAGEVLIQGKRAPIRGRVSMDMIAVDVTHLPGIKEGGLATLIGQSGKDRMTAWEIALWAQTIPYEIFCGISPRVPRVYLD